MRRRFVIRPDANGESRLVEVDLETPLPPPAAPYVRTDLAPYRSMRTGEIVRGRAEHREHLHRHELIEIGNERPKPGPAPGPANGEIVQDIKRELARDPGERRAMAETALRRPGTPAPVVERILKS